MKSDIGVFPEWSRTFIEFSEFSESWIRVNLSFLSHGAELECCFLIQEIVVLNPPFAQIFFKFCRFFRIVGGSKGVRCRAVTRVSGAALRQVNLWVPIDLLMGLVIHSNHKQELSSVYHFIVVLYNLCS